MIPLLERFQKKAVVGMDLGSSGIKFLKISRRPGGEIESISHWYYPGTLSERIDEISALRAFLLENKLQGVCVACNIEDPSLKIRRVELPKMPEADLPDAIKWQLRDVVEGSVADYVVQYSFLEELVSGDAKKVSLLVYAVKKSVKDDLRELLVKVSLKPVLIEPTSVSLLAAFDALQSWGKSEFYGLVDVGESKAVFSVVGEGKLYFSRPLAGVSTHHLKEIFEKELKLPARDIEHLKRYLMGEKVEPVPTEEVRQKAEALLPTLYTRFALETQRSIDAFSLMFHREKVDRLFLCGGGANLVGLREAISKNVAVSTSILDPSGKFKMGVSAPHIYNAALGLALFGGVNP